MAENILRESGYMLPQSDEVCELLETMIKAAAAGFPERGGGTVIE